MARAALAERSRAGATAWERPALIWDLPNDPANAGAPASHNSGTLLRVNKNGTFTPIVDALDQPTSVDFIGNTAYVITLTGKVIKVTNVGAPPFGKGH